VVVGWCHAFGSQIQSGCDQPMVAGETSCCCSACGVVCRGRFRGCAQVWAMGPDVPVVVDVHPRFHVRDQPEVPTTIDDADPCSKAANNSGYRVGDLKSRGGSHFLVVAVDEGVDVGAAIDGIAGLLDQMSRARSGRRATGDPTVAIEASTAGAPEAQGSTENPSTSGAAAGSTAFAVGSGRAFRKSRYSSRFPGWTTE